MKHGTMKMKMMAFMTAAMLTVGTMGGAVSVMAASGTQTVRANLNMRSSKSLTANNVVLVIPKGKSVTVESEEGNNWYKVTYKNSTGYVKGGYFGSASETKSSSTTTKTMYENLNMRSSMDKSTPDNIITVIGKGKSVTILNKESGGWYKVKYNGKTGYIMGGHFTDDTSRVGAADAEPNYNKKKTTTTTKKDTTTVKKASAGDTVKTTASVNLRKGASSKQSVLTQIPSGKKLTVKSVSGNWYQVEYGGKTGYIYSQYATK